MGSHQCHVASFRLILVIDTFLQINFEIGAHPGCATIRIADEVFTVESNLTSRARHLVMLKTLNETKYRYITVPGVLKAFSPAEHSEIEMIANIAKTGNSESTGLSEKHSEVTRSKDRAQDKSVEHGDNVKNEASATNLKRKLSAHEHNKKQQTVAKTGENNDSKSYPENRHKVQPDNLAKAKVAVTATSKEEIASTKDSKDPKEHTEAGDKEKNSLTNPAKESVKSKKTSKDNTTSMNSSKGALTNKPENQVK